MVRKETYAVSTCVVVLETRVEDSTTEEKANHDVARKAFLSSLKEMAKRLKKEHPGYLVDWDERGFD